MRETFKLFAYGTLASPGSAAGRLLDGCERVGPGAVTGTLYDLGDYPALLLDGNDRVPGVIWRCPTEQLRKLDRYEGTEEGLFRRAAVQVDGHACWVYVAGPKVGHRLVAQARVRTERGEG